MAEGLQIRIDIKKSGKIFYWEINDGFDVIACSHSDGQVLAFSSTSSALKGALKFIEENDFLSKYDLT